MADGDGVCVLCACVWPCSFGVRVHRAVRVSTLLLAEPPVRLLYVLKPYKPALNHYNYLPGFSLIT